MAATVTPVRAPSWRRGGSRRKRGRPSLFGTDAFVGGRLSLLYSIPFMLVFDLPFRGDTNGGGEGSTMAQGARTAKPEAMPLCQ